MSRFELWARIHSLWRVPLILTATGVLSSLSVFFSLFDGTGRLQHWCARKWSQFIFLVSRVEVRVVGLEKLRPETGYVFAANHLSMFDHWAFLACLPCQFRFVAKASLFRIPFLGWHLRRSGNLPVERSSPRRTIRAFQNEARHIRSGISFIIYPEGMRTWDGRMVAFRRGAFLLAFYSQAPIVPVTIIGAHHRLPRGSMVIRPGRMELIIHDPIPHANYRQEGLEDLAARVREIILSSYREEPG